MDKVILPLLAVVFVLALGWIFGPAAAIVCAVFACLGLTWYFADNEPVFGPATEARVTFKQVIRGAASDFAELLALQKLSSLLYRVWLFWAPRLTNPAMMGAIFADLAIAASGQDTWLWLAEHPIVAAIIILINLLATTPTTAPTRIPAPPVQRGMAVPST